MAGFIDSVALARKGSISKNRSGEQITAGPLIFPENLSSSTSFNNHFMIINILDQSNIPGPGRSPDSQTIRSIVLYMPNTLNFTQNNQYEDTSLTALAAKAGLSAIKNLLGNKSLITRGAEFLGTAVDRGGQLMGVPINPQTEVLFANVALRTFQFDFLLAPTSASETQTLKDVIKELRSAAAVSEVPYTLSALWKPPNKLNIHFFRKTPQGTVRNEHLPRLRTCVIESLDIDYAPTGVYSTFSNGHPVSTRIMLRVKEDEVLTKAHVSEGY